MLENSNNLNTPENSDNEEQGSFFSEKNSRVESSENKLPPTNEDQPVDRQRIFSGNGDISGLKSSVLKEQNSKEKIELEKALQKHQQKSKGDQPAKPLPLKQILIAVLVLVLLIIIYMSAGKIKKMFVLPQKQAIVAILEQDTFVYDHDFRLKIKTSATADKATLQVINNNQIIQQIPGKIISTEKDGSIYWELATTGLKKGEYIYKCYAKNSKKADSLTLVKGIFVIK